MDFDDYINYVILHKRNVIIWFPWMFWSGSYDDDVVGGKLMNNGTKIKSESSVHWVSDLISTKRPKRKTW